MAKKEGTFLSNWRRNKIKKIMLRNRFLQFDDSDGRRETATDDMRTTEDF